MGFFQNAKRNAFLRVPCCSLISRVPGAPSPACQFTFSLKFSCLSPLLLFLICSYSQTKSCLVGFVLTSWSQFTCSSELSFFLWVCVFLYSSLPLFVAVLRERSHLLPTLHLREFCCLCSVLFPERTGTSWGLQHWKPSFVHRPSSLLPVNPQSHFFSRPFTLLMCLPLNFTVFLRVFL